MSQAATSNNPDGQLDVGGGGGLVGNVILWLLRFQVVIGFINLMIELKSRYGLAIILFITALLSTITYEYCKYKYKA